MAKPEAAAKHLNAYPNPASDILNIEIRGLKGRKTIAIIDATGKVITYRVTGGNFLQLNVRDLPGGMYILKMEYGRALETLKIVR